MYQIEQICVILSCIVVGTLVSWILFTSRQESIGPQCTALHQGSFALAHASLLPNITESKKIACLREGEGEIGAAKAEVWAEQIQEGT